LILRGKATNKLKMVKAAVKAELLGASFNPSLRKYTTGAPKKKKLRPMLWRYFKNLLSNQSK